MILLNMVGQNMNMTHRKIGVDAMTVAKANVPFSPLDYQEH